MSGNALTCDESTAQSTAANLKADGQHLRSPAEQNRALREEVAQLRNDLEALSRHLAELAHHERGWIERYQTMQTHLGEAHEQLFRRDEELRDLVARLSAERDAATSQRDEALRERDRLFYQATALLAQCKALDNRLTQIRQSLPGRVYVALRRLLVRVGGWRI